MIYNPHHEDQVKWLSHHLGGAINWQFMEIQLIEYFFYGLPTRMSVMQQIRDSPTEDHMQPIANMKWGTALSFVISRLPLCAKGPNTDEWIANGGFYGLSDDEQILLRLEMNGL